MKGRDTINRSPLLQAACQAGECLYPSLTPKPWPAAQTAAENSPLLRNVPQAGKLGK